MSTQPDVPGLAVIVDDGEAAKGELKMAYLLMYNVRVLGTVVAMSVSSSLRL
jgi:hypothetical protein